MWGLSVAAPFGLAKARREVRREQSFGEHALNTGCLWLLIGPFAFTILAVAFVLTVGVVIAAIAVVLTVVWGFLRLIELLATHHQREVRKVFHGLTTGPGGDVTWRCEHAHPTQEEAHACTDTHLRELQQLKAKSD